MKKIISLSVFILFCGFITNAQLISFGLRGGVNFQNINGNDETGNDFDNDVLTGFHAGITADIMAAPDFYFQTGLLYSVKGAKTKDVILGQTINHTLKISYLELPLTFLYKPLLGSGHLLLGFGPYIALGIGGTFEDDDSNNSTDVEFKNTVSITDPLDAFYVRPLDMGANFLVGYELAMGLSLQLNAQLGLLKINPKYEFSTDDDTSAKNTGFGFSLGYRF
jgi:hypothetical protein